MSDISKLIANKNHFDRKDAKDVSKNGEHIFFIHMKGDFAGEIVSMDELRENLFGEINIREDMIAKNIDAIIIDREFDGENVTNDINTNVRRRDDTKHLKSRHRKRSIFQKSLL